LCTGIHTEKSQKSKKTAMADSLPWLIIFSGFAAVSRLPLLMPVYSSRVLNLCHEPVSCNKSIITECRYV
jgi:hypothetical protein